MASSNDMDSPEVEQASRQTLAAIMVSKIAINLQYRITYPFLPAISRGLGVSLETASLLIGARSLIAASSPLYGALTDRFGRRALMLLGMGGLLAGVLVLGISPAFSFAMAAFLLFGLGKASYDPAAQAYVGDTVPYARRGRLLALLELSWSLSWLLGVPLAGFMIAKYGWRSPFWLVGGIGLIGLAMTWRFCSEQRWTGRSERIASQSESEFLPRKADVWWKPRWATRNVVLVLLVSMLTIAANENLFIVFGAWMEDEFGLSVSTLGVASSVIAIAELVAESASAGIVDRLGKRKSVMIGLSASVAANFLLPLVAGSLPGALAGVMLLFLTFEFGTVSMLPLMSELVPKSRGTVLSFGAAAMAAGRTIGAVIGPRVWDAGGLQLTAIVSGSIVLIATLILWRGVREAGAAAA